MAFSESDPKVADLPKIDALIGKRIRAARGMRSISCHQLAQALGISYQQMRKYENAQNRITVERLFEIADYLGLPPLYFLENQPEDLIIGQSQHIQRMCIELIKNFLRLRSTLEQEAVSVLIRVMADTAHRRTGMVPSCVHESVHS